MSRGKISSQQEEEVKIKPKKDDLVPENEQKIHVCFIFKSAIIEIVFDLCLTADFHLRHDCT